MQVKHPSQNRQDTCVVCDGHSQKKSTMRRHQKIHSSGKCVVCEKKVLKKSSTRKHIKVHMEWDQFRFLKTMQTGLINYYNQSIYQTILNFVFILMIIPCLYIFLLTEYQFIQDTRKWPAYRPAFSRARKGSSGS